jgi:hypothetical protein
MPKSDQVEKSILEYDGIQLQGLIGIDEYTIEDDVEEIPGNDKTVPVRKGVRKVPTIGVKFKISRNSKTMKILQDWYFKNEYHDVTKIVTDGAGNEIRRELWPNTECSKWNGPGYDAASPVASQILTTFCPEDIIPIEV